MKYYVSGFNDYITFKTEKQETKTYKQNRHWIQDSYYTVCLIKYMNKYSVCLNLIISQ